MKKLEISQMENLQGGRCWSIKIFGLTLFSGGSNEGEGDPVWVHIGYDINTGLETGYWAPSPNTCP